MKSIMTVLGIAVAALVVSVLLVKVSGRQKAMDRISAAQQDALLRFLGTVMRRVRES